MEAFTISQEPAAQTYAVLDTTPRVNRSLCSVNWNLVELILYHTLSDFILVAFTIMLDDVNVIVARSLTGGDVTLAFVTLCSITVMHHCCRASLLASITIVCHHCCLLSLYPPSLRPPSLRLL